MRVAHLDPNISFDCSLCTWCCDQPWDTEIEPEKAEAVQAHNWSANFPQLTGKELVLTRRLGKGERLVLQKGEGNRCIFLDDDNLCIIHKELGLEAKPDGCIQFPFIRMAGPDDDYISANFGCRAVQEAMGRKLPEHAGSLPQFPAAGMAEDVRLSVSESIASSDLSAVVGRLQDIFSDPSLNIWGAFADAVVFVTAVAEYSGKDRSDRLAAGDWEEFGVQESPKITPLKSPFEAPMASRFLFATTLYADVFPHMLANPTFFERLSVVPKLMSLAQMKGVFFSKFLAREVNVSNVWRASLGDDLDADGHRFLARYCRARFWQRLMIGKGLSVLGGLHQMIQDLNAILFYSRAEAMERGAGSLDESLIKRGAHIVEFHIANQTRVFEQVLRKYIVKNFESPMLTMHSLRLMRGKAEHKGN
jgi:Fe-S-cluster containining protein